MKNIQKKSIVSLKAKSYKLRASEGITIYLAMLTLSAALTTAIFVSTVFVREFKISKEVADSLKAVYAADTAMEYTLYQARVDTTFSLFNPDLFMDDHLNLPTGSCAAAVYGTQGANEANKTCRVDVYLSVPIGTTAVPACPATSAASNCTRIVSKGSYSTSNRAIEIVYENL